ncbi:MAG: glycosyltransferase family 2 protein [Acidobacteria bacterium]|nr:glycosyltransferase family 2 protein [Acidobacteriota bacterium]
MDTPLVSVLMTCYNREQFLPAAIESVLWQTFDDWELVVVDDRSTDGSVEIANRYARRDSRIRVVVNETNLGDYPNRNRAASLARGKYIKYHDSDDVMYPHCLMTMVAPMEAEPRAAFGLSLSNHWPGGLCPMLLTPRQSYQREFLGLGMFQGGPACALFRTEVLRELGGFENLGVGSDNIFWLKACARYRVLLLPADLFWYRLHPGQEFQSDKALREYAMVPGEVWRALLSPECPLEGEELEQAKRNRVFLLAKATYIDLKAGRWPLARLRIQYMNLSLGDWLRYLRRARRNRLAGTPLDANGEYVIPDWATFQSADSAKGVGSSK